MDREVRESAPARRGGSKSWDALSKKRSPDIGAADEAFHILRRQHFVVDRGAELRSSRDD